MRSYNVKLLKIYKLYLIPNVLIAKISKNNFLKLHAALKPAAMHSGDIISMHYVANSFNIKQIIKLSENFLAICSRWSN